MVILDTCAVWELLESSPKFSKKTSKLIDDGAYILSISFAEIACKVKLGKLEMSITPRELFHEFSMIERVEIISIGVSEWLDSIELSWDDNRDPADRIITTFAAKKDLPIVTTDKKIKKFYKKVIW